MTDDELALLGHLIGDGCTLPRHVMQYTTRERVPGDEVARLATRFWRRGDTAHQPGTDVVSGLSRRQWTSHAQYAQSRRGVAR